MPPMNIYRDFEPAISERAVFSQGKRSTPSEDFAKETVAAVLKKNPPAWFSSAHFSTIMAIMYHLPISIRDFVMRRAMKC